MRPGLFVLAHLVSPSEKFWGRLEELSPIGLTLRGLNVESFEDWLRDVARGERDGMGLVTMFVPLHRLERLFLDERVGGVESYREAFERRVGAAVETAFGNGEGDLSVS
jgi:hypothetical protein